MDKHIYRRKILWALTDPIGYHLQNEKIRLIAFVFMTNHIHLIIESSNVIKFVHNYKTYTTTGIGKLLKDDNRRYIPKLIKNSFSRKPGNSFQIWQQDNYPELIETSKFLNQKITYIHDNPIKKGYVNRPENWKYSSASAYIGEQCILPIYKIETF